jgi:hypothetical protein
MAASNRDATSGQTSSSAAAACARGSTNLEREPQHQVIMTSRKNPAESVKSVHKLWRWFQRSFLKQPWMMEEFASPILQESLLLDKARCDAYREAIRA